MDGDFTGTDRFVIERHLGSGSMGSVYLAHDRQLGSRVALKVLLSVDASSIYRFKKEFRALADVSHPNLVTLHELFSEGEHWFFTMEYVEGKDLLSYLHRGRRRALDSTPRPISEFPDNPNVSAHESFDSTVKGMEMLFPTPLYSEERLRAVLEQIVEGLLAVHAAGKLHRDLKPENVIVTEQGRVVLLDFGIVIEKKQDIHATLATIMGTPAYMAPEQCYTQDITEAADWYALGIMLYEALTGDVPFDGTPLQVITRKQEVDPVPPREVVSGVPDDLNDLCMQLMQRKPSARPSGEAVLRALRAKRPASLPAPAERRRVAAKLSGSIVGRGAQVRELDAALQATDAGAPVLVLLHGPPGIGKTTLIDAFVDNAVDRDRAIVLRGRCYERESVPFKAFDNVIDSLSRYLRRLPTVDAARMLPRDSDVLAELFPVLKRVEVVRRNRRPRALPPEPQELRQRAFRALKEMFSRIADAEPLVVCIDDLQWSDLDSARLLGELISGTDRPALTLVCAYRSGEVNENAGLSALLEKVRAARDLEVREISVGVLSAEQSVELAGALLGPEMGIDGARKVGFESGGNPQVLTQLVRHVQERRASGKASTDTARGLISFERVLEQRLSSLSTDARTLLEMLCVAGRPVPEAILTLVASFNVDLPTALAELRGMKLVRGVVVRNARAVEIYHDTIREALTGSMAHEVLVGWHRRIAAALEASGAMDLEALTDHLLGAGDRERASLYASRAAAQADMCLAFDKAARLYGVAAEHAPDPGVRRSLQHRWADALVDAGRSAAAAGAYVEAAEGASVEDADRRKALAGVQFLFAGKLDEGLPLLAEPLIKLDVALAASFQDALVQVGYMWRELRARGFAFVERAEHEIEPQQLARLDLLWGITRGLLLHEIDRPLPLLTRYLMDALEVGEPLRIVRGLSLFHVHVDVPWSRARKLALSGAIDVAEVLARRLDFPEARALIAFSKGLCVYQTGMVDEALEELASAEDLMRNHCRGTAYEMRQCRMVRTHVLSTVYRELDASPLKEWVREAEERGDPISAGRLRLTLAAPMFAADDIDAASALLDSQSNIAGVSRSPITAAIETMVHGYVQLYRGDSDACHASFYLLEDFLSSALSIAPFLRVAALLLRARLALVVSSGDIGQRGLLAEAIAAVHEAEMLSLPCFVDDCRAVRASIAIAEGQLPLAIDTLNELIEAHRARDKPSLLVLAALRARGRAQGEGEGARMAARAEDSLKQRGVLNPRSFVRLFIPGI